MGGEKGFARRMLPLAVVQQLKAQAKMRALGQTGLTGCIIGAFAGPAGPILHTQETNDIVPLRVSGPLAPVLLVTNSPVNVMQ